MTTHLPDPATTDPALVLDGRAPVLARRVYAANLVAQMAIVVTGALVRLTGSGLGCPDWPTCADGSITPTANQAETWHKLVEFGNRTLTGVLLVLAVAAVVLAVLDARRRRREALAARPALTWLAAVPLIGTFLQIPLGGVTVLTKLNPIMVGSHLLLSLAIVALTTVLVARAGEPGDEPVTVVVRREVRIGTQALTGLMGVVLVVGMLVTASGPHAGDERTTRLGLDPRMISWLHADLVVLCIGLLIGLLIALRATGAPERTTRAATHLLMAFFAQGLVGYVQYFTGEPWVLVALHVLLATVIWWATIRLLLSTRTRGVLPLDAVA